jgi:hypothetical protein
VTGTNIYTTYTLLLVGLLLGNDLGTTKHLLLGKRLLISKYTQPLLRNYFSNKHVAMETVVQQQRSDVFCVHDNIF